MINIEKPLRVFKGKVTANGDRTMLSVSESTRDKQTGEWKTDCWWSICVPGQYPCESEDKVRFTISKITAASQRDYRGKTYVTLFADGVIEYKGQNLPCGDVPAPTVENGEVIGLAQDLPF